MKQSEKTLIKTLHSISLLREINEKPLIRDKEYKIIDEAIFQLKEREQKIIRDYYGINNLVRLTSTEVAKKYNISPERLRQIKNNGIRKLRHLLSWRFYSADKINEIKNEIRTLSFRFNTIKSTEEMSQTLKDFVSIQNMPLNLKYTNALIKKGYYTIYDLEKATDKELLKVKNVGIGTVKEIRSIIRFIKENGGKTKKQIAELF